MTIFAIITTKIIILIFTEKKRGTLILDWTNLAPTVHSNKSRLTDVFLKTIILRKFVLSSPCQTLCGECHRPGSPWMINLWKTTYQSIVLWEGALTSVCGLLGWYGSQSSKALTSDSIGRQLTGMMCVCVCVWPG